MRLATKALHCIKLVDQQHPRVFFPPSLFQPISKISKIAPKGKLEPRSDSDERKHRVSPILHLSKETEVVPPHANSRLGMSLAGLPGSMQGRRTKMSEPKDAGDGKMLDV